MVIARAVRSLGLGMPPEVARRAFDPFFTTALGQGGTGLGLFITLNAVTNVLGGRIEVKSKLGQGTTFEVTIPLVAPEAAVDSGIQALSANTGA